ncbi:hypothetical protein [Ligilactobacillus faecis]|uniref:hypothetical protein n=1 Tax=Ligilactobacillus faecis TaxID=762833 RepID=UPI002468FF42|nr:hypothetical protein [Ligilactobacillus faecis]WGN89584.1 hypothetical protein QFX10_00295 [Ligilactobacillus faecis]
MKNEKIMRIDINGISKSELEKLRTMARKNGHTSLNGYLQFLLRREIENDLVGLEKTAYKNHFESMQKTLFALGDGYIQSVKYKKKISKYFLRMTDLVSDWLYLMDDGLKEFAEYRELSFDEKEGIVSEKTIQRVSDNEKLKSVLTDESPEIFFENKKEKKIKKEQKRIEIRGLSADDIAGLKLLSKQAKAANLNQYMLDQVYLILKNGGLDIYDNRLADDALAVKNLLVKVSDQQTRQELHDMEIISKLNVNIELMINWIKFISLAQSDQL